MQIPYQYNLAYEYKFSERISTNFQVGILTKPFDKAILNIMQDMGTGEEYIRMIENSFKFGVVADMGLRYHFTRNYAGIYLQYVDLSAKDTPTEIIESYYNVDINKYPFRRHKPLTASGNNLQLESKLLQLGIIYGRRFIMPNPKYEIHLEFSISKNLFSSSTLSSEYREVESLSDMINNELKDVYKDYAYVPSVNIYLVYRIGK